MCIRDSTISVKSKAFGDHLRTKFLNIWSLTPASGDWITRHSRDLGVPLPDKQIGENSFIFRGKFDLFQSLQKEKVLFVSLISENKQKIFIDAFKKIGTWRKAIKTRSIAIKDGLVVDESLFFLVNLFREVWFLNFILESNSLLILVVWRINLNFDL